MSGRKVLIREGRDNSLKMREEKREELIFLDAQITDPKARGDRGGQGAFNPFRHSE